MFTKTTCCSSAGHTVRTVVQSGWSGLENGQLLKTAALEFDVLVTVDQKMPSQQNISIYPIGLIILECWSNDLESIRPLLPQLISALSKIASGNVIRVKA